MAKPNIKNLLLSANMAAFAAKPPAKPAPPTLAPTPPQLPEGNLPPAAGTPPPTKEPAAAPVAGAPVRNVRRSESVEIKNAQGVKTFTLCLFEPQVEKFAALTEFLEDNLQSSKLGSLALRTALYLTEKDKPFVAAVTRVTPGKDYVRQNVQMYVADYRQLMALRKFARVSGIKKPTAAVVARAAIELAQPDETFLEEARALRERQDKRGIS